MLLETIIIRYDDGTEDYYLGRPSMHTKEAQIESVEYLPISEFPDIEALNIQHMNMTEH